MYQFHGIDFGPTTVDVEASGLREAMDKMGHLYSLHQDARFLEAHVRFFHDVEPYVVPKSRDDAEGYVYRGFQCLRTGCNITFKEKEEEDGIFPGRYRAYINGDDKPKLYDPKYDPEEILSMVAPDTAFVKEFGVDIGEGGARQGQAPAPSGPPPQERPAASQQNGQKTPWGELSPRRKVKRVESQLKAASLSKRPNMIARIANWKEDLPSTARDKAEDLIVEFATEEAYDARLTEIDSELQVAEEESDEFLEVLEEKVCEVATWPPHFMEAGRALLEGYADDSYDVEDALAHANEPQPA